MAETPMSHIQLLDSVLQRGGRVRKRPVAPVNRNRPDAEWPCFVSTVLDRYGRFSNDGEELTESDFREGQDSLPSGVSDAVVMVFPGFRAFR